MHISVCIIYIHIMHTKISRQNQIVCALYLRQIKTVERQKHYFLKENNNYIIDETILYVRYLYLFIHRVVSLYFCSVIISHGRKANFMSQAISCLKNAMKIPTTFLLAFYMYFVKEKENLRLREHIIFTKLNRK
jgi:hypothetical protein